MNVAQSGIETIFRAELSYVTHSLRRLGVAERDLDDVAQDVFITVNRRLDSYDPHRPLRPWLFGIALRHTYRYRDKAHRRRERMVGEQSHLLEPGVTGEAESRHEARALIIAALDAVPLDRRSVLIMADIDGFTAPEIATALEIPINTVYSRLRLARNELARRARRLMKEPS